MTLENIALCDNGNIELCDNGNIAFCGAPCSCPCGSWPGAYPWATEPCGGLLDEYDLFNNLTSPVDSTPVFLRTGREGFNQTRFVRETAFCSGAKAKATATPCKWGFSGLKARDIYEGSVSVWSPCYWAVQSNYWVQLQTNPCRWASISELTKASFVTTGSTPVGVYSNSVSYGDDACTDVWFGSDSWCTSLIISEPAP